MKKLSALIVGFVLLASGLIGTIAFATPSKPHAGYGCHFYDNNETLGTAYIDKCSCKPVDNFLKARVKIQSKDKNGKFSTSNWSSWATGYDVTTKFKRTYFSGQRCTSIWGEMGARCGSGSLKSYSKLKSR